MKKLWVIMLLLLMTTACQSHQNNNGHDDEEAFSLLEKEQLHSDYVFWHGRHHAQDEAVYFYHTATGFQVRFTGNRLDITLSLTHKNSDVHFSTSRNNESLSEGQILVLSEPVQTFRIEFDTYEAHEFQLVKRSEPQDGITALVKLDSNGKFHRITRPEEPPPHFLLMGASGISGNGALGLLGEPRTTANSSSLHAFGYLTAAHFDGTFEFVSNSGWGLVFGFNDPTGTNNIARAYDYIGIDAHQNIVDSPYQHAIIPDVIIINIGGNDFSAVINQLTGFERENKINEFKEAVADFIFKLRHDAPDALILWTMTSGSQNGTAAKSVIDLLDSEDKTYVHVIVIKAPGDEGDPIGANNHASFLTHQKSAAILIDAIETYTHLRGPGHMT